MRLIDADVLVDKLNRVEEKFKTEVKQTNVDKEFQEGFLSNLYQVVKEINNQPTAYDIDKVVDKLEKKALKMSTAKPPHTYMKAIGTHEAIKIVKAGGVDG